MRPTIIIAVIITYAFGLSSQSFPGLSYQWITPPVLTNPDQEYTIHFSASVTNIDSIVVYPDRFDFIVDGQIKEYITLYDNGVAPDREANDRVFTSPAMQVEDLEIGYKPGSEIITFEELAIHQGAIAMEYNSRASLYIRHHKTDNPPEVKKINDNVQYTSHVFNTTGGLSTKQMSTKYYQHFEDDKHFIATCSTVDRAGSSARSSLFTVRETIIGIDINNTLQDYSEGYGSESTLEALIQLNGDSDADIQTFNHELAHRWCGQLPDTFRLNNAGSHWNGSFALVGDAFNGTGVEAFVDNGDSTYTAVRGSVPGGTYSALDLYLAGYIGIDDIPWPILTIQDVEGIDFVDGNVVYTSSSPLRPITKEWYLEEMPLRIPNVESSRKEQGVAFFINSNRLLTPEEISYWHTFATELERTDRESIYSPYTHHELTDGLGRINTRLTPRQVSAIVEPDASRVRLYPNPTSDYLKVDTEGNNVAYYSIANASMMAVVPLTPFTGSEQKIFMGHLPTGSYVLILELEDGRRAYERVMVVR